MQNHIQFIKYLSMSGVQLLFKLSNYRNMIDMRESNYAWDGICPVWIEDSMYFQEDIEKIWPSMAHLLCHQQSNYHDVKD